MKSKDHALFLFLHQSRRTGSQQGGAGAPIRHPPRRSHKVTPCWSRPQSSPEKIAEEQSSSYCVTSWHLELTLGVYWPFKSRRLSFCPENCIPVMVLKNPPATWKLMTASKSRTNKMLLSVCSSLEAHLIAGLTDCWVKTSHYTGMISLTPS